MKRARGVLSFSLSLAAAAACGGPGALAGQALEAGVQAYHAGRYAEAVDHFHEAAASPATAAEGKAWLVPALMAANQGIDFSIVDAAQADPRYANAVRVAFGLGRWHKGDPGSASSWVGPFCERGKPGYEACPRVRGMLEAGGPPPDPAEWPALAGLPLPEPAPGQEGAAENVAEDAPPAENVPAGEAAAGAVHAGPAAWLPHGAFRVGDRVRYTPNGGPLWYTGVVERVGPDPDAVAGTTDEAYLVRDERVDRRQWLDRQRVAGMEREPFWTGFFVGDWEVSVPMAMGTIERGGETYRIVTGGMRLPPLRVNPDGTYLWVVEEDGATRVIRGRWVPREDAPGLVLLHGDRGGDWSLANVTDRSGLQTFGRDQIHLSSDCCTYLAGQRITDGAR
ncbi:MAG TPA: hypothetical protein VHG51_14355 [Longimicrobiaceae bacterium]|nr:hypothetical protein [Longimicrobiaceae bacterium]